jgi:hypothetical protein
MCYIFGLPGYTNIILVKLLDYIAYLLPAVIKLKGVNNALINKLLIRGYIRR